MFTFELGRLWTAILIFVYFLVSFGVSIALVDYTNYTDYTLESSSPILQVAILVVTWQVLIAALDFALARPLLARKKRKQQELVLPLAASGDPTLAERLDEHLDGFGER